MLAGSATLLGAFGSSAFSAERKTYLATRDIFVGGGLYVPDAREPSRRLATIAIVDIGKRQIDRFAMDFFAHGFALKRGAWGIAATFQKIGPGAAEIDIVSGKVLRTITPEKDRLFYGHGAYSLDGRLLYSTERDEKRKTGLIAIRDAGTLAYLGEFPTYGDHPHDCHLIDDGATMVVTNGGGAMGEGSPASLTYIDVASNQLLEKIYSQQSPYQYRACRGACRAASGGGVGARARTARQEPRWRQRYAGAKTVDHNDAASISGREHDW